MFAMWGIHVDCSSTEKVMGCDPKLSSRKPKVGAWGTLNQSHFKDFWEPWPHGFQVDTVWDDPKLPSDTREVLISKWSG
jgi:hypothetical protein